MTTDPDPDLDRELERLLSAARTGTEPSSEARARIRGAVERRLSGGASVLRARDRRVPVAFGAAVVAAAVLAVWWAASLHAGRGAEGPAASLRASAPGVAPAVASDAKVPPSPTPTPPTRPAPSAAGDSVASSVPAPSAPELRRSRTKAVASASDWPAGVDELTLIRQMQQALRSGSPGRALGFVAEHERRFPSGSLTEEREGVRAAAQCVVAPRDRASILATFAARFGSSPYLERVKAACR